jgi:outer membrane protein OmpA-like peptidoglycan-associated protein
LKRLFFLVIFVISVATCASQMKREAYIDIPTANFTQGLYINVNTSYPIKNVDDVKFDPNIGVDLSYKKFGVALKWYDGVDFALDLSYQILAESEGVPGFSVGIGELSSSRYVSPAGSEDVFNDEDYAERPPEIASVYLVGTKKLNRNFEMTAGIARGRFVGYGPVSKYFNIDAFSDEKHENWALGLFGGAKLSFSNGLAFIVEADGRDANIGLRYQNELVKGTLALNKLEVFNESGADLSPRISLDLSYKIMDMQEEAQKEEERFPVVVELIDEESREPVTGYIVITNPEGDTVESFAFKNTNTHSFILEPGVYPAFISAIGYKERAIMIAVKGGKGKNLYTITLSKIEESEEPLEAKDSVKVVDNFGDIKDQVEGINIKFSFKKFDLSTRAYGILDRIVELIRDDESINLMVIGHTCDIGTYEDNQVLSEKRAENVKEYLIGRGISPDRIYTEAYGEKKPIADNDTEENRKKNRRVQFILYREK